MKRTLRRISWSAFNQRIATVRIPDVDRVVAIARGGLVPAAILAARLKKPLHTVTLRMYDDGPMPKKRYARPRIVEALTIPVHGERVLLVDDVSRSGATLTQAKKLLGNNRITTCVVAGEADIALFPFSDCVLFPWDPLQMPARPRQTKPRTHR